MGIGPRHHGTALRHALGTLKPGGTLAVRDYGLYDHAQLRAGPDNVLTPRLHVRGDGTLAYYFEVDELRALLEGAGFVVHEAEYVTIRAVNRKKGVTLHRVWVHARATRPKRGRVRRARRGRTAPRRRSAAASSWWTRAAWTRHCGTRRASDCTLSASATGPAS
jgi:hypothetical protein